ncbi:MAG: tRNA (N(6)-L-threonylcarbamoyladenosine(37)-C(2))-methylthiotransferase MtaB [Bacteroidales bacterium]|nr:tRNA (N(6)-L-threonylcarbamoyladenosine(37)-C(2))-methylthiotransferase MtaB [Bacteroidales bacterium]
MNIATHTLGCKLNFAETSHLQRKFAEMDFNIVPFHEKADIYVINTCTVTSVAEKKCRNAIRQAIALNPKAVVAVVGCFAQNDAPQIASIPGVSIVLGNDRKHMLPQYVSQYLRGDFAVDPLINTDEPRSFQLSYSGGDRTRTFFKIQDGCDYFCSYCAIPFARGRNRSATIAETVAMAREIAATGTREVVLTGVNTGTFGLHTGENFLDLLRELDKIEGILRYRISSIEPNLISPEVVEFVAASRAFLPHFHIPLQAGSDKVLKMMHRHYDTALYAERLQLIKRLMPHACIAADVITGFNGEDDDTFAQSKAFINSLPISYLHVFPYSDRPNTLALKMPEKVAVPVRKARCQELLALSAQKRHAFIMSHEGTTRPVLWEHTPHKGPSGDDMMQGWTDNYIRLQRPFDPALIGNVTSYPVSLSTIVENFACED